MCFVLPQHLDLLRQEPAVCFSRCKLSRAFEGGPRVLPPSESAQDRSRGPRATGDSSSRSGAIASIIASAGPGPSTSATAMARLSATTGVGMSGEQVIVESDDLGPVGRFERVGGAVHGLDPGLELEGTRSATADAGAHDRMPLLDHRAVPPRPVLIAQEHEVALDRAGRHSRLAEQHQREQPRRLGLVGHQLDERTSEPDRLGSAAKPVPDCRARCCRSGTGPTGPTRAETAGPRRPAPDRGSSRP